MSKLLSKTKVKQLNKRSAAEVNDRQVVFLLQDVTDAINVGSLFRTADAAGIVEMALCGQTPTPPVADINITSRGLERSVTWQYFQDTVTAIDHYRGLGYQIIGVEIDSNSENYADIKYESKVCLILGNEALGIYKKHLPLCDKIVHIPMLGKGQSLNVNISGAVVAYHVIST